MMKHKKHFDILIFLILMSLLFVYIWISVNNSERNLKNHMTLATARITDVEVVLRGDGLWLEYEFSIQSRVVKNKKRIFCKSEYRDSIKKELVNKKLPILYDSTDNSNNELPITLKEYSRYGIKRPDSLNNIFIMLDNLKFGDG